ncbi:MAG: heme NO-binding protein [Planctomycetes bacterium]|nr:heme NO-binding protein [Planctomycetota bacterium]
MYGMVNQALEALVTERFGAETWMSVRQKAGISDPAFITMKQYPDEVTYSLAVALSEHLQEPLADLLRAFGVYWVAYARRGPWGRIMLASGSSTYELLASLDAMHARIAISFPELRPPSFKVRPEGHSIVVDYHSHRPGLAPFVIGLIEGIGTLFGESVTVEQVASKDAGATVDSFRVSACKAS